MTPTYFAEPMPTDQRTWEVCATVLEPAPLICAFAAHYRALGASKITLFLDAPDPDLAERLRKLPTCHVVQCDEPYWTDVRGKRKRPPSHIKRQLENVYACAQECEADWLLHVDADEFLTSTVPVSACLTALPDVVDCVKVNNVERIFPAGEMPATIFDGLFRSAPPKPWFADETLFDPGVTRFLNRGLTGHKTGKCFSRTGRNLVPGIHSPRLPGSAGDTGFVKWALPSLSLLHFDGLTPFHWASKLLRFAGHEKHLTEKAFGRERLNQIRYMLASRNAAGAVAELHARLKCADAETLHRLRALGLLDENPLDIAGNLERAGLGGIDLSPTAFDAEIARLMPELAPLAEAWKPVDGRAYG